MSIQDRALQACQDDLFRLEPVVQLSDSEILNQYETLCQKVSQWVDHEMHEFIVKFRNVHDKEAITDGGSTSVKKNSDNVPKASEYLLSSVIHKSIQQTFGDDVILLGLHPGITRLIFTTKEYMLKLKPKRGMSIGVGLYL